MEDSVKRFTNCDWIGVEAKLAYCLDCEGISSLASTRLWAMLYVDKPFLIPDVEEKCE